MALPKQVNALIDPDDLSVYADRGKLNLEQIGFLNVSGTTHTLHTPGGANGEIQYNDGGGFGGATNFEFDDGTGQILFPSGTISAPSISFKDSSSTGFFFDAFGLDLHIMADGTEHFDLGGGVTRLLSPIDAQSRNITDINLLTAVTGTFTDSLTVSGLPVATSDDVTALQTYIDAVEASDVDALTASGGAGVGGTIDFVGFGGTNVSRSGQTFTITSADEVAGGLNNVVEDLTPELGGTLDALSEDIININELTAVTGTFTDGLTVGTGTVQINPDGITVDGDPLVGGPKSYGLFGMVSDQTSSLAAPSHLELNSDLGSTEDITVTSGSGQTNGQITLPSGKVFRCRAAFSYSAGDAADQLCCKIYNVTDDQEEGVGGMEKVLTNPSNLNDSHESLAYINTTAGAKTIEFRILSGAGVSTIFAGSTNNGPTWMAVEEL